MDVPLTAPEKFLTLTSLNMLRSGKEYALDDDDDRCENRSDKINHYNINKVQVFKYTLELKALLSMLF